MYWIILGVIFVTGCALVCYAMSAAARDGEELGELLMEVRAEKSGEES